MTKIIKIENLGKVYKISHEKQARYITLRDVIADKTMFLFSRAIGKITNKEIDIKEKSENFWALSDINIDIQEGERVGIIGRNGAGKTTLLKILSRITEPTTGRITIKGRVASLLEVGTGFHPELTGRENIFLNGAILGMSRNEVKKKFDEIVEFSEIEKFLDTPVKRYSSGMYVRLAFAIAAHLEPEILLVDEVLAVGDSEFQKKCLGKMEDVSKEGRTLLFVSHNMSAINSLCSRCIYLMNGHIVSIGDTDKIINEYLSSGLLGGREIKWVDGENPGDDIIRLSKIRLINKYYESVSHINISEKLGIEITYEILKKNYFPVADVTLYSSLGECVFDSFPEGTNSMYEEGIYQSICWIPENLLNTETYNLRIGFYTFSTMKTHIDIKDVMTFDVIEDIQERKIDYMGKWHGIIRPKFNWEIKKI